MGGVTTALFGGSKQKSSNQAYGPLSQALMPNINVGNSAMGALASLLGIGGGGGGAAGAGGAPGAAGGGAPSAFQNYLDSSGYKFLMDSGSKAITGNAAASGLLNSGSTLKRLTQFGQDTASTKFDDYLKQLTGLGTYGLNSAGIVGNAGSTSSGKSSNGIIPGLFG